MKESSVDLYFFSGTGNTLLAARAVAEGLRTGGKSVRLLRLEKGLSAPAGDTALGIAVTTACFSTYPFAWEALEQLPTGDGQSAFALSTMGGFSGGLRSPLRKLLDGKGYRTLGYAEFVMPSNYANKSIPLEENRIKIGKCQEQARIFARALLEGRAEWRSGGLFSPFFNWLARKKAPWKMMKRSFPLEVDKDRCIQCGKCARLCPAKNIVMEEYPRFLDHCVVCQRCVAFCPPAAIGVRGKKYEQYRAVEYDTLVSDTL